MISSPGVTFRMFSALAKQEINIKVISTRVVGNDHIKSILGGKDGSIFNGFVWNGKNSSLETFLSKNYNKRINLAGKMRLNYWRGVKKVEFIIEDVSLN